MSDPQPARSNLTLRLLTAAVTVPLILYSLFAGPHWLFPLLAGLAATAGTIELFAMIAPGKRFTQTWGLLASLGVFLAITINAPAIWLNTMFIIVVIGGLLAGLVDVEPIEQGALRTGWAIAGPLYIGGLFGVIAQLFQESHGGMWVLLTCLCAFWSDTGGYFAGQKLGKHKLYERVSPKKTWEGSAGGLLGALVGGLLVQFFFLSHVPLWHIVTLTLVAAAAGQAGDLCESLIKRSVGVKDSGTILPGHGGMLDRADALLFATTVVWAYVHVIAS